MGDNPLFEWLSKVDPRILWIIGIIILLGFICGAITFFSHLVNLFLWFRKKARILKWILSGKRKLNAVAISLESSINRVLDDFTFGAYSPVDKYVKVKGFSTKENLNIEKLLSKKDDKLVIPLSNDDALEKSIAKATYSFTKDKIFAKERNYVQKAMSTAIELFFSKRIIIGTGNQQAIVELYKLYKIEYISQTHNIWLDKISEIGSNYQYASVFFSELYLIVDYFFPSTPKIQHSHEIEGIADFIYRKSVSDKGVRTDLDYSSKLFNISLIIIGEREKRRAFGIAPYDKAVRECIKQNVDRIYLIGGGFLNSNAARSLATFYKLSRSTHLIYEKETSDNSYLACLKPLSIPRRGYFEEKEKIVLEALSSICPEYSKGQISVNGIYWSEDESKVFISVYSIDKSINPVGAVIGINAENLYKLQDRLNNMKVIVVKYDESDLTTSVIEAFCVRPDGKEKDGIVSISYDERGKKIDVKVSNKDTARMLVGRRGSRIKVAQKLLDRHIEVDCIDS